MPTLPLHKTGNACNFPFSIPKQATPLPSGSILDKIIVLSFFNFIRIFAPDKAESTSVESLWPLVGACLAWVWAPLMWAKEVAEIAQSVEHFTRNEKVSGSSPDFGSRWTTQNSQQPYAHLMGGANEG